MTLEEFLEQKRKAIKDFAAHWTEANKADPDNYHAEMSESDWNEQFYFFDSLNISKSQQPTPNEQ